MQLGSTDAGGAYAFAIPTPGDSNQVEIVLSTKANRYQSTKQNIQISSDKTSTLNLALKPLPVDQIGVVQGRVTDSATNQGVSGVSIVIMNAGGGLSIVTKADGTYVIPSVGFNTGLVIRVITKTPPCLVPAQQSFDMANAVVEQNFTLNRVFTDGLKCPLDVTKPSSGPSILPHDSSVRWQQADLLAIQTNAEADAWNAGHVNDILKLDGAGGLAVATETGGVWAITSGAQALPLSDTWNSVHMTSLAFGPDGSRHLYAGTEDATLSPGGVLFETDTSTFFPLFNWLQVNPKPPCGSINRILSINVVRRILLACNNGVWWSPIPPAPSAQGTYRWKQAIPGPGQPLNGLQRTFSGLVKGPGWSNANAEGTIIASSWGGAAPRNIIFYGGWLNGDLVLSSSSVDTGDAHLLFLFVGRTSAAACLADPTVMFAVGSDYNDNRMAGVWKSRDAGRNWSMVSSPPDPGEQGFYNNVIAISADCQTVALGWQNGTFVSFDGGGSWKQLQDTLDGADRPPSFGGLYHHLHADIHALTFDPANPTTLYIGSDGGVASANGVVQGGKPTFTSSYNRQLLNLQFHGAAASSRSPGLVAGAFQDNDILSALLNPQGPGVWQHLDDCSCDGGNVAFVSPAAVPPQNDFLTGFGFGTIPFAWGQFNWNGSSWVLHANQQEMTPATGIPIATSQNPRDQNGLVPMAGEKGAVAVVKFPRLSNSVGQVMYAASARGSNLYGLFANDNGSDLHWEIIGYLGADQTVSALSSFDGRNVFVGTDQGNIYRLDSPYPRTAAKLTINPPDAQGSKSISAIVEVLPTIAFATMNVGNSGYVLAWQGQTWDSVGGGLPNNLPFYTLEAPDLGSLFAANGTNVYVTHDLGKSWLVASDGLPAEPEGVDLHFAIQPDGTKYLYLATNGRSLWRAALP
jgi:hypothetical protein